MRKMSLSFFCLVLGLAGCVTGTVGGGQPVQIRFDGQPNTTTETRYLSTSRVLTYNDGQLVKDRTESVDFTVATKVKAVDKQKGTLEFSTSTTKKDGTVLLHDLAFPEKGEVIDFVIKNTGEIVKAGRFPRHSIFYIPSLPIPEEQVQIGDTWELIHVWNSARDGIPLKLEVAAILKDIVKCEKRGRCADIEISGHVNLGIAPSSPTAKFESRVWGRMLFSLDRGDIIWAQTRGLEEMAHDGERVLVHSCMTSEMLEGAKLRTSLECEPKETPVQNVPRL